MPTAARNTGMWLCLFFGGHLAGTCISVGDERALIGRWVGRLSGAIGIESLCT